MSVNRSLKISDARLNTYLANIIDSMSSFLETIIFHHYTDHGIQHSNRVVNIIGLLLEDYPNLLNEQERFVLLASAYLHDIGMQSPQHAGLPLKEYKEYTWDEIEKVRDNHHVAAHQMILESVSGKLDLDLGLDRCSDYARFIAIVSMYHRKMDLEGVEDAQLGGSQIRLRLLASLLRLSDALDLDYRRVNTDVLKLWDIPLESKYHWWAHHYVSSVQIERGKIGIFMRFPEKYCDHDLAEYFRRRVEESVKSQFFEVYDILDNYGIRLYREPILEEVSCEPEGVLEPIPEELLEDIMTYVTKSISETEELGQKTGVVWYVDGVPFSDDKDIVQCISNITRFTSEEKNVEALNEIRYCLRLTMSPWQRLIVLNMAGILYRIIGDVNSAELLLLDAMKISDREDVQEIYKIDAILAKSAVLGNIGIVYGNKGELDEALKCHQEALKIDREIGNRQGEASDIGNIGNVYSNKGELDEALKHHQEALKIDREIGSRREEASDIGNIGIVFGKKGELDEALKRFHEALKIEREVGYRLGEAIALGNIGNVYSNKGELDEALKHHQEALDIHRETGDKLGEAGTLGNIGIVYSIMGELDEAEINLQLSYNIFIELGIPRAIKIKTLLDKIKKRKEDPSTGRTDYSTSSAGSTGT